MLRFAALVATVLLFPPFALTASVPPDIPPTTWADVTASPGKIARLRALTAFALTANPADIQRVLNTPALGTLRPAYDEIRLLSHALTTRDLPAARTYHAIGQHRADHGFQDGFFGALAQYHPELISAELACIPPGPARHLAVRTALLSLAPRDADAAIRLYHEFNYGDLRLFFVNYLLKHAPAKALEFALAETSTGSPDERNAALRTLLMPFCYSDLDAILQFARQTGDAATHRTILDVVEKSILRGQDVIFSRDDRARHISPERLQSLLRFTTEEPPGERQALFGRLLADFGRSPVLHLDLLWAWHQTAPTEALAWAADPVNTPAASFDLLLSLSPEMGLARIEQTSPSPERTALVGQLTRNLALENLPDTLTMASQIPPGPERDISAQVLSEIGALHTPDALAAALNELPADDFSRNLTSQFAFRWLQEDATSALAWFNQLPDAEARAALLHPRHTSLLSALTRNYPTKAIAQLALVDNPDDRYVLLDALADNRSAEHRQTILDLINELPDSTRKNWLLRKANKAASL
ncbi:MAG: hypothetical protein ABII82_02385 [Verrucomicrobiota bacterium]